MFLPTVRASTAPVTTAIFSALGDNPASSVALEEHRASDPTTKSTIGAIILVLARTAIQAAVGDEVENAANTNALIQNCSKMFHPGVAAQWVDMFDANPQDPATESDHINAAVLLNEDAAPKWIFNFVNAAKKKKLEPENVEGWFAEMNHSGTKGQPVASLINQMSPFFPDKIGDAAFRNALAPGIWSSYRQSRTSAGAIMSPLLPEFRLMGITTLNDTTEVAIEASKNDSWDVMLSLQIPNKYKAYAALFLEVSGRGIDKWHQGNDAVDELPAVKVKKIKQIFRRFLEIKNDADGIDAINTIAGFNSDVITSTW